MLRWVTGWYRFEEEIPDVLVPRETLLLLLLHIYVSLKWLNKLISPLFCLIEPYYNIL